MVFHDSKTARIIPCLSYVLTSLEPFLRFLWAVCTFGHNYPRRRVGENYLVCFIRTVVTFLIRFACILGAIWYLGNWLWYVQMGSSRPFNVLRSESDQENAGVLTPILILNSPAAERQTLNVTDMAYTNLVQPYRRSVNEFVRYEDNNSVTVYPAIRTLSAGSMGYVEVVVQHIPPQPSYGWTRVRLMHPNTTSNTFTSHDLFNYYYFLPGHYVTIRYTPLQFFQVFRPNSTTSVLDRFKSFVGLMEHEMDFSYQSTVEHIPFPQGVYDNMTSVIILRPQSSIEVISYQEEKSSFKDTMSQIGGLISIVGSVLVFLFGVSLMSPWGFIAGIPFFRRRITSSLAKSYNSPEGLSKGPFTTNLQEIGVFDSGVPTTDMRVTMLKERIDELELVLSEYYLDGEVFQFYAEERDKVRLERGLTRVRRSNVNKEKGSKEKGSKEAMSDDAHFGDARHHQRQYSEPSVTEYYQEQQRQERGQHKKHRHFSEQTLLRRESDDREVSPSYQLEGLLQQDHHAMHQSYLQQQLAQSPTSLSGYPSNRNSAPPTVNQSASPPMIPSPFSSDSVLQGRPGEGNLWKSGSSTNNAPPTSVTTIHPIFATSTTSATAPALSTAGGVGSATVSVSTHEHLDMSELSHIPRQP